MHRTIVEYTISKKPVNAYPKRIISPSRSSNCCADHMVQVGEVQEDGRGFPFHYRRCNVCGFTLRHFLPVVPSELPPPIPRQRRLVPKIEKVEEVA